MLQARVAPVAPVAAAAAAMHAWPAADAALQRTPARRLSDQLAAEDRQYQYELAHARESPEERRAALEKRRATPPA